MSTEQTNKDVISGMRYKYLHLSDGVLETIEPHILKALEAKDKLRDEAIAASDTMMNARVKDIKEAVAKEKKKKKDIFSDGEGFVAGVAITMFAYTVAIAIFFM